MTLLVPVLAHHMLWLALPFFGPVVVIGLGLVVLAIRDRLGRRPHR